MTWIFLLAAAHLLRRGVRDQAGEVFDRLPLSRVEVNVVQGDAMGGGEDRKQVSCYYQPNISTGTIEPPWTKNCGGYSSSILVIHILLYGGLKKQGCRICVSVSALLTGTFFYFARHFSCVTQNGQKMTQNGQKMTKNGQKMTQNGKNDPKLPQMA